MTDIISETTRTTSAGWVIERHGIHPKREESLNTLFCVGNGLVGLRGNLPELPRAHKPGTYLAGYYEHYVSPAQDPESWCPFLQYWGIPELARDEQRDVQLVSCPNPLDMQWTIDGEAIDFTTGTLHALTRRLDQRAGVYTAEAHWTSPGGREIRLTQQRFAEMACPRRVWVHAALQVLDAPATVSWTGRIDTDMQTVFQQQKQLYTVSHAEQVDAETIAIAITGNLDTRAAAMGMRLRASASAQIRVDDTGITGTVDLAPGQTLELERLVAVATDRQAEDPLAAVQTTLRESQRIGYTEALAASASRWADLWEDADVRIEGNADDQLGVRFSIYNLLIAASQDDPGVSIPAKGLTSCGYNGMVFWDTDIYMVPFYCYTRPELARHLVQFRWETLAGARGKAAHLGLRGASYPWMTGVSGHEECFQWLKLTTHQHHITADVAYAAQQYVEVTGDQAFYEDYAAEVLIETARFWVSKAVARGDGTLGIPAASGPDEFHVVCDDSAYVHHLASYNLETARNAVAHLQQHAPATWAALRARIGITDEEVDAFASYPARIRSLQRADGVFEQCAGFFELQDIVDGSHPEPFLTQTVKQADTVMLFYLLPDRWPQDVWRANLAYYEPRTVHGSSLSHAVHGLLAIELGEQEKGDRYIRQSLSMDLHDEMGNTDGGAHMAANGMNWIAVVRAYGGARPQGEHFRIDPHLPADWTRLRFRLKWRGADFVVDITPDTVEVHNLPTATAELPLHLCSDQFVLAPGKVAKVTHAIDDGMR